MNSNLFSLIILGIMLLLGGIFYLNIKKGEQKQSNNKRDKKVNNNSSNAYKTNPNININKEDVFKFMEFDKVQDNMIIQQNGAKFTAVIKCKGINYNLMSEVEQLSVEEGFINFLNTLKFPIQIYVQAQNVDLKESINKYKENMREILTEFDDLNSNYNIAMNSFDNTEEELQDMENKKEKAQNVLEYGQDIVRYVEKLSLNKSMLQRSFYVLVSYYKSEITNASNFKPDEIVDICYSELFTRVQNIISGLAMSSVTCLVLNSNELAELIYSAYNRDDKNYISVRQALESGFHRLYSISEDAISKKHVMLLDNIRKEAEYKAAEALAKAIEEGNVATLHDVEDSYDQESSRQAIEMIKRERIDEDIKDKAKKKVIEDYRQSKKTRIEEKEKELKKSQETSQEENVNIIEEKEDESNSDSII